MINKLIAIAEEKRASDLHINVGVKPLLRIDGKIKKIEDWTPFTEGQVQEMLEQITNERQRERFYKDKELDFTYTTPELGRYRVNALYQKGLISLAFRLLSAVLTPLSSLGLPPIYGELSLKPRGLILVTGPTGSGKSTSMASMIQYINQTQERHIITIEDPIEYLHENIKSLILQRAVESDTHSFSEALRRALRHDPDVIVVGEMRDLTTISTALTAAETGHLVLGTLHTLDAAETINRIVDAFPSEQQAQIVLQLSQTLLAVLSQTLVPLIGKGRVPACEVMVNTIPVKNMIRSRQLHQLSGIMEMSNTDGMQTLNQELAKLVISGRVSLETALDKSSNRDALETLVKGKVPKIQNVQPVSANERSYQKMHSTK